MEDPTEEIQIINESPKKSSRKQKSNKKDINVSILNADIIIEDSKIFESFGDVMPLPDFKYIEKSICYQEIMETDSNDTDGCHNEVLLADPNFGS